jgi:hypothetical protein
MPITQEPTLFTIDLQHNQFEIVFGLEMVPGEAPLDTSVPNLVGFVGDVYNVDFLKVNTPARGNFPAVRCIQFAMETTQVAAGEVQVGNVYIVNPQTAQVLAVLAATPGPGFSSLVMGNLPFFAKSNQAVHIIRAPSVNCIATLSATAFTFDCSSFLTAMVPAPTLYSNGGGPGGGINVNVTNGTLAVAVQNTPLDVNVASPDPLPVTVIP